MSRTDSRSKHGFENRQTFHLEKRRRLASALQTYKTVMIKKDRICDYDWTVFISRICRFRDRRRYSWRWDHCRWPATVDKKWNSLHGNPNWNYKVREEKFLLASSLLPCFLGLCISSYSDIKSLKSSRQEAFLFTGISTRHGPDLTNGRLFGALWPLSFTDGLEGCLKKTFPWFGVSIPPL